MAQRDFRKRPNSWLSVVQYYGRSLIVLIDTRMMSRWLLQYPELREAVDAGNDAFNPRVEGALGERAIGFWLTVRGGLGCLNRFSASISGASAGVRLPSGAAAG